jgi:hypothetical protein
MAHHLYLVHDHKIRLQYRLSDHLYIPEIAIKMKDRATCSPIIVTARKTPI